VGDSVTWKSGGEHFHTVSFGIDPRNAPLIVPVGKGPQGPILAINPLVMNPILPKGDIYMGGMASSGILGLAGNYANLPGQRFLKAPFTLTFAKPGVYTYYCLAHAPLMKGTITVVPATS
jgi:plastocyanin